MFMSPQTLSSKCSKIIRFSQRFSSTNLEEDVEYYAFNKSDPHAKRLYVWGCAEHGALGELKVRSKKIRMLSSYVPVRKRFAYTRQIVDVACGFGFSLFAVKSELKYGKLFGCGINTDCQIGYHCQRTNHPLGLILSIVPVKLPLMSKETQITKVSAGRAHSSVLTDTEGVFLFGNNCFGQCARPVVEEEDYQRNFEPTIIKDMDGKQIVDVVNGLDHSLFLTENGEVYACGWGADGQTGIGSYKSEWMPTKLEGDIKGERIVKLFSKTDSTLALNDKGELFGWGNSEYQQLCLPDDVQQCNTPVQLSKTRDVGKIVDMAIGGTHSIALNEDGEVFTWGYGALGKGPAVGHSPVPVNVPSVLFGKNQFQPDTKVASVTCGVSYMMAITNHGDIYAWGKNSKGQLGLGHFVDQFFPFKVCVGGKVQKVSCGLDHTIAVCKPFC